MSAIRDFGQSIVSGFKDARSWIGDNIIGEEDPYTTRQQTRMRDYAVMGAGTGAVAGAAIGVVTGFNSQGADKIQEQWVHRDVLHPSLRGYSHWAHADTYQDCHTEGYGENEREVCDTKIRGWWHSYSPRIEHRDVGDYQEPRFVHQNKWEPLLGGFLGALGGAVIGLGVGVGIAALRNALDKEPDQEAPPLSAEQRKDLSDFAGGSAIVGTVAGAGLGAWLGSRAGAAELGKQEVHVRSWMVPTMQRENLGYIPQDFYEYNWGWGWPSSGYNRPETDPVYRDVPVYHNGQPTFHETSQEFKTNRYGPIAGGILGGLMGAGIGLASGVAVGVGAKLIAEHKAEREAGSQPARLTHAGYLGITGLAMPAA